jgi:lycopene elongase/hydratase (dihydrobisanhydrobacterioruberin-forming)
VSNLEHQKKKIISVFFKEFIRIRSVISWSAIAFIGFILGISSLDLSHYVLPLLVFLLSTFFIMSSMFSLNNYYDVETDRENPRRKQINAIASKKISKKTAVVLNLLFIIIALVLSFFITLEVFLFCAFLLFLGWAYSAPPFRLKGRPVLDIIVHFIGFFSYIIWGSLLSGSISLISWLVAISIGIWSTIPQISNHIHDYSYDKKSNTRTFAVWIGLDKAKIAIEIVMLLHLILLIPLIILYSLSYTYTIVVIIGILLVGFLLLRPTKGAFPTRKSYTFYITIVISGAVYMSCLIYHMLFLLGVPTIGFLASFF